MIEVAEAGDLEIEPDRAERGGIGDVVVDDVVGLKGAGGGAAQHHVGRAVGVEVAEARHLKIEPDRAEAHR